MMVLNSLRSIVFAVATAVSLSPALASGPSGSVTFQGEGFVETVTSACATNDTANVGDYYRTIYLYGGSSGYYDTLSIVGSRVVSLIMSQTPSLVGEQGVNYSYIGSHAILNQFTSTTNFTIGSVGGLATAQAINLKVVGTIDNFEATSGCSITFHADLVARPN